MDESIRRQVLRRLNYAKGHLDGVRKMAEEDRYCVDILKQSYAVRRALEKIEELILEGHLNTCVVDGIQEGNTRQVIQELMELYGHSNR